MAFGYSKVFADRVVAAYKKHPKDPLLALGAFCIKHNIVPSTVADNLGVSKQAVYDWFAQKYSPRPEAVSNIEALLAKFKKQYKEK